MALYAMNPEMRRAQPTQKAQRIFTDREEPRKTFWRHYEAMREELGAILPGQPANVTTRVLEYYGNGGIGKTQLRKKLMAELRERPGSGPAAFYDFDTSQNRDATDIRKALVALRASVLAAAGERNIDDFTFPMFDAALFMYKYKQGLAKSDDDPALVRSWLDDHPKTGQAINILSLFLPGIDVAAGVVDTAISEFSRKRARKWSKDLAELNDAEPAEILQRLPYYFALDLSDNMAGRKEPLVIFLDTYEALVDPLSGAAAYKNADLWLRDTTSGNALICNTTGVLWVILGRNRLTWIDSNPEWEGSLETHLLAYLTPEDSASFLASAGVANKELQYQLAQLSGGLPLYLDLCVNIYEQLTGQGRTPAIDDFGTDREQLVERLLRYMDHTSVNLVYRLACLSSWDTALLRELFSEQEYSIYEGAIQGLSFLSCQGGVYTIHKIVRDLLLSSKSCTRDLKVRVWAQAEAYYGKLLKELTAKDDRYGAALAVFAEYGVQRRDSLEELTAFYNEELKDKLAALTDLYKTAAVLQCIQLLLAHPAMASPLLERIYLQYAGTARIAGQYQQAMEYAQKAVDLAVAGRGEEDPFTLSAMGTLASSYSALGKYQEALALGEKVLERRTAVLGPDHPNALSAMSNLAFSYFDLGRTQEAIELQKTVVERYSSLLGPDHPSTITAMHNLASSYSKLGKKQEALELREKVLEHFTTTLGPDHPDTIAAMHNLAVSYSDLGKKHETLKLREKVLERYTAALGPDHPNTLKAMYNLSNSYSHLGKKQEALELREKVLERCTAVLGPDHPDTLTAMSNLAVSYFALGKKQEAAELQKTVTARRTALLGPDHPDTIAAMKDLAVSYSALGKKQEALELREKVLERRTALLGSDHPDTLNAMNNLAISYSDLDRHQEALELWEKVLERRTALLGPDHPDTLAAVRHLTYFKRRVERVLELQEKVPELQGLLGPDHPDTLAAMSGLADSYSILGKRQEALELREKVLERRTALLGPDHPDAIRAANDLALSYSELGRKQEALELWENLLERCTASDPDKAQKALIAELWKNILGCRTAVLGPDHPDTFAAMRALANAHSALGEEQEALELKEKILERCTVFLGPDHPDTLTAMSDLAFPYFLRRKRQEALELRKTVLERRTAVLGPDHPDTLSAMEGLALLYSFLGKKQEALELREKALERYTAVLGPDHPDTLVAMNYLAISYSDLGRKQDALGLWEKTVERYDAVLGLDHPDAESAMHNLANAYSELGRTQEAMELQDKIKSLERPQPPRA